MYPCSVRGSKRRKYLWKRGGSTTWTSWSCSLAFSLAGAIQCEPPKKTTRGDVRLSHFLLRARQFLELSSSLARSVLDIAWVAQLPQTVFCCAGAASEGRSRTRRPFLPTFSQALPCSRPRPIPRRDNRTGLTRGLQRCKQLRSPNRGPTLTGGGLRVWQWSAPKTETMLAFVPLPNC